MGRLSKHRIKNAQCTETQSPKHNFAPADKWAYQRTGIAWAYLAGVPRRAKECRHGRSSRDGAKACFSALLFPEPL